MREKECGILPLRPHHGMCLAFFKGEGYSDSFTENMARMLALFLEGQTVRLCIYADEICAQCPNRRSRPFAAEPDNPDDAFCSGFVCVSEENIVRYDRAVLEACGLKEGAVLTFKDFVLTVQEKVIETGARKKICGGCCWNDICENTQSRWERLIK